MFSTLVALVLSFAVSAQSTPQTADFFNSLGTNLRLDTAINTGTAVLTSRALADIAAQNVTVQVNVTKISGIVGGTITLLGSLDGVNFSALRTVETQTALATITATDATASYQWRLSGNHFRFYRVSYAGTGTMSASISALLYRGKL